MWKRNESGSGRRSTRVLRTVVTTTVAALALIAAACERDEPAAPATAPAAAAPVAAPPPAAGAPPAPAAVADWCAGHRVPESKCTVCNPELIPGFRAAGDWCEEHGFPESVCPICNPQQPPPGAPGAGIAPGTQIRFRSADIERAAGIEVAPAAPSSAAASIECPGRIEFDRDRVADVRAAVPGVVVRLRAELGQVVRRGAPLFELESSRVGDLQADLRATEERVRAARAHLDRQRELRTAEINSVRQLEMAEQELATAEAAERAARAGLRMAGASGGASAGRYVITAPIDGTIVRRPAVVGAFATEETSLATIADPSTMWAVCDVAERDASALRQGQRAHIELDGASEPLEGTLTWVAPEVDPRTRTVAARAEIANTEGSLRGNQLARLRIETGASERAVAVPTAAVQRVGEESVVFVRTEAGVYEPRSVRRGRSVGDLVQVEGDVHAGDPIVTTGAFLLKTELLPGSIGAGCCEVEGAEGG